MDGLAVDASLMTIVVDDTMYVCVMTDTILNSIAAAFGAVISLRIRGRVVIGPHSTTDAGQIC